MLFASAIGFSMRVGPFRRGGVGMNLFATGTRYAISIGSSEFVACQWVSYWETRQAAYGGAQIQIRCRKTSSIAFDRCPATRRRRNGDTTARCYGTAQRLCRCKAYGKKLAAYVRRRTEPVEFEGENRPYAR